MFSLWIGCVSIFMQIKNHLMVYQMLLNLDGCKLLFNIFKVIDLIDYQWIPILSFIIIIILGNPVLNQKIHIILSVYLKIRNTFTHKLIIKLLNSLAQYALETW
jgi:hypothetical protein